jgi:hypothetical protein
MSAALAALTSVASESESDACDSLSADSLNELPSGRLGIHYRQAKSTLASIRTARRVPSLSLCKRRIAGELQTLRSKFDDT